MIVEAELKARIRNHDKACRDLGILSDGKVEIATYRDTYYDFPGMSLEESGREFRLRIIETDQDKSALLTIKAAAIDETTQSKPEYETEVSDPDAIRDGIAVLGYIEQIRVTKHCRNYRFTYENREVLATVVQVFELDGAFIEVEARVAEDDVASTLESLRRLLQSLNITKSELTTEKYTDAVQRAHSETSTRRTD